VVYYCRYDSNGNVVETIWIDLSTQTPSYTNT
jgi:hypothetical protein